MTLTLGLIATATTSGGCSDASAKDPKAEALGEVKAYISQQLAELERASSQLMADAPRPDDDGWNATADGPAVLAMKADWMRLRSAYETIEGAIAVLFSELDDSTDQRYDGFLATHVEGDDNLFDDRIVTGVHAVERILWSDTIPARVVTFESGLPGYRPAAFPGTRTEADDFKNKLCTRLANDIATMRRQFAPLALDAASAYRGVMGSMAEQREKASLGATGEDESRYAEFTLADMRTNVAAGNTIFATFEPWLTSVGGGPQIGKVKAGFGRVAAAYAALTGDSLPEIPPTWNPDAPSEADRGSAFGRLWTVLDSEADARSPGSLTFELGVAAEMMGIPAL